MKKKCIPCKPQFYFLKMGLKGAKIILVCFRDDERGYLDYVFLVSPHRYMLWVLRNTLAMLISTNNICVHGEVRKISALFG